MFLLFLTTQFGDSLAQVQFKNVNTFQLTVDDGLAMSRVDDLICDKQNILWIKSNRGLQYWDGQQVQTFRDSLLNVGTYFQIYPHREEGIIVSTPGLARQFTYSGLRKELLFQSNNAKSEFVPIPLNAVKSDVLLIHPDSIYPYHNTQASSSEYLEKINWQGHSTAYQYVYEGRKYIADFASRKSLENTLVLDREGTFKILTTSLRNTILITPREVVETTKTGLHFFNNYTDVDINYPDNLKANYYSSILDLGDNKFLVGIDNVLYEYDRKINKWTTIYKNIDQNNLLQTGYYDKLLFDNYNNIWAITVNEGLLKIYNNTSFRYFGTGNKKLNFVKNIVVDEKENRVINSALNGGIMVYDTLGKLIHHLSTKNTNGLVTSATGVYQINPNQYIFNNHRDSLVYGLSFTDDKPEIIPLQPKKDSYLYYQDAVKIDTETSFLLFNTLYKLRHSPFELVPLFHYKSTKSCMIKDNNTLWIGCIDGIIKYEIGDGDKFQFIKLPGEGYVRSIAQWKDDTLALGSDKGLSLFNKTDKTISQIYEGCIYCLLSDDNGNVWAGTGSGLLRLNQEFKKTRFSNIDGLQNNEFNTNACIKSESGKMYFGGLNGITSFDPLEIANATHTPILYINELKLKNKALVTNARTAHVKHLKMNHDENNLSISVGAVGKYESNKYNYQYYVDGISSEWIDAKKQTQYNFNLSPGKYKFYFKASNAFEEKAVMENPLYVTIKKPWWNQWWFYISSAFALIGIITYYIQANEKQKYLKKKYEWDLEHQRQEDRIKMSKELHDNIGSRLTFLVSSIENIKKAFQLNSAQAIDKIDHITDFGKDTIADLRSMMWVLSQQTITIQDLQLKILDYLNIAKNTYRNIDFQYEGPQSMLDLKLDSKLSQNIFRIIQESIHNSIKHASPTSIAIQISNNNGILVVSIEDNGSGFDINKASLGNGINNIKSRLATLNSRLNINSVNGSGTIIHFKVVLDGDMDT